MSYQPTRAKPPVPPPVITSRSNPLAPLASIREHGSTIHIDLDRSTRVKRKQLSGPLFITVVGLFFLGLGIVIAWTILAACSDSPKIDASTDEALMASMKKLRNTLSEPKRKEFDEAIQVLAFSQIDLTELLAEGPVGAENLERKVRQSFDGKTADQIIIEVQQLTAERKQQEQQQAFDAQRLAAKRKQREQQQALDEIRELEETRVQVENAREQLKHFQVIRSRFYLRDHEFMGIQPVIELTVKNGTDQSVLRAHFDATLASANRTVPWHQDTFSYHIPGGLEPGEEADWKLVPNMFSDWAEVNAPTDAVFTVAVKQLDGADGEPIYSTTDFGERERKRLNELKKKYGVE